MTPEELTAERGKTHGDFTDHARATQVLKFVVASELSCREVRRQEPLTDIAKEAIDMILHKIGRIIAGDPNVADHWDDIAGYAHLVSVRLSRPNDTDSVPCNCLQICSLRAGIDLPEGTRWHCQWTQAGVT